MTTLNGEMAEAWRIRSNHFYWRVQEVNTAPMFFTPEYAEEIEESLKYAEGQFQAWYQLALTDR